VGVIKYFKNVIEVFYITEMWFTDNDIQLLKFQNANDDAVVSARFMEFPVFTSIMVSELFHPKCEAYIIFVPSGDQ